MKLRRAAAFVATATLALFGALAFNAPARAEPEGCLPDVGKKVPVLFVHGLNAGPEIWSSGEHPMIAALGEVSGIKLTDPFNYRPYSLQWVTNPNIGTALANRIACMAASSRQQGGKGKVVVVAHSMGGLATREAIAESPEVAQALGMVITIATPNTGSDFSRQSLEQAQSLCSLMPAISQGCASALSSMMQALNAIPALATGSPEIAALPDWPTNLPVYAIAGNIRPRYGLFGLGFDGQPSGTDTLVTTASALHGNIVNGLGGTKEFVCTGDSAMVLMGWTKATCEHGALVDNSEVQAQVASAIKGYIAKMTPVAKPSSAPTPSSPAPKASTTSAPPETNTGCSPSEGTIEQAVQQYNAAHGLDRSKQIVSTLCKSGWAVIRVRTSGVAARAYIVLQHVSDSWRVVTSGDSSVCQQLPTDVRYGMCM